MYAGGRTYGQTHNEANRQLIAILQTRVKILRSAHTVYLCVLCGSENKQRLFPYTALTGFYNRDGVFTARYGQGLYI